jgi:DNA-binding NarL/FixJ family response regulator
MNVLAPEHNHKVSINGKKINILLFGNCYTGETREAIEAELESSFIIEVNNGYEMIASINDKAPDVIIMQTDRFMAVETFKSILIVLAKIKMNKRTIIISENPFDYLANALDTKVAALLHIKTAPHNLASIIRQISSPY